MKSSLLGLSLIVGLWCSAQLGQGQAPAGQFQMLQPAPVSQNHFLHHSVSGNSQGATSSQIGSAGQHYCSSHELNQAHFQSLGILNEYNQDYYNGVQSVNPVAIDKTPGVNTISVIFHVVHNPNNPAENVSNGLIMQVYNDLVEDFQLLNADAANARTGLGFIPADANINFCLATQDPSGNPLAEIGVVRVSTTEDWYNSNGGEENKMKASATGGSQIWNRNKYMNVWICDISNGAGSGTAGYAYRPTLSFLPSASIDGIVLDYNLGMNNDNVLTHEVGHYLGLDHTWGGSGGCGNDDGFTDTPNTNGPSFDYPGSCTGSQQTCVGTETQYENYMDYSNCTVMFTQDQADYMLTLLQGIRGSLLISTGCDPTNTPPNSAFSSIPAGPGPVVIPQGGSVSFFDQSTNVPTAWNWVVSGTPGTDWAYINATNGSSQNPQVEFYNVGLYNITLTASNTFGADPTPASQTGYVQVVAPASGTGCDTLRNWDPADADANGFYYYNSGGNFGYFPGHNEAGGGSFFSNQYASRHNYVGSAQVRRLSFAVLQLDNISGSGQIVMKVWQDAAGVPGTQIASEVIPMTDINEGAWNEFDFTTPPTVTGNFWAGFQVFYGAQQDTIIVGMTDVIAGGNNSYYIDVQGIGWYNGATLGISGAMGMDVMLSNGPSPVADFTATNDLACPGGVISVNGSASQNTTNYFWYLTDDPFTTVISSSNTASNTYTFPTAGDYAIYLFADGSCQTDGVYLPVTVAPAITATVTPTATTCGNNNGSITITAPSGGNGTYYYSLDGQNYYTSNTFTNLPSGTYTVYVATLGDNCEAVYSNITIGSSSSFAATVSPNVSVCPGGSATITASGGVSYQWFNGSTLISTSASTLVSPATQTQYTCVVTNGSGCQSTVYTTVNVHTPPAAPVITPSGPTTFCAGSDVDLVSSYPTGNVWSTTQTGSTITVSSNGSYSVTHTDANGCSSTSSPVSITVVPLPTISIGTVNNPTSCATATGSIQVLGSGTGTVNWSGTASGSASSVTLPYTIPSLLAGSYNITFTNATGCTSSIVNQALTDPNPPVAPVITANGPTTFCNGGSVTLSSSYPSGNTWSTTATTQNIIVTTNGVYTVTYTDLSGCSASSAPISVTVNNNPTAPTITPSGPTSFCDGGSVVLNSSQGSGNTWSTLETTPSITVTTGGPITVTFTNSNGCSTTSAVTNITVYSNPTAPTITPNGPTTFCDGGSVTLSSSLASGNEWNTTETTQDITVNSTGLYFVTYTDGNGCSASSADVSVIVNDLPTVTLGALGSTCENYAPFSLSSGNPSGGTYSGPSVSSNTFDPSVGAGVYTITYTYTDGNGCSNTDNADITVDACLSIEDSELTALNVYPNPFNDQFTIVLEADYTYEVFDAMGRIVANGNGNGEQVVNISQLESGSYTLRVTSEANNYDVRLIKSSH